MRWSFSKLDAHIVVSEACVGSLVAVLPDVPLARDPERDRRAPLLARAPSPIPELRADGKPVILFLGPLRPAQRARHDARRVRAGAPRATRATCGSCVVGDGPLRTYYQHQLDPERRARRRLGRPRRLDAAALLRVGRRPLHALQPGVLRHGAARGDELRTAGRGEPHLGVPARDGARPARPAGRARQTTPTASRAALLYLLDRPAERARMGHEGRRDGRDPVRLDATSPGSSRPSTRSSRSTRVRKCRRS